MKHYFKSRKLFLYCAFMTMAACLGQHCVAQSEKQFNKMRIGEFVKTEPGTIAFLPRLGNKDYIQNVKEAWVLPTSGKYTLPKRGTYFFEVSNWEEPSKSGFILVAVFLVYDDNSPKPPIQVYRNDSEKWAGGTYEGRQDGVKENRDLRPKKKFITPEPYYEFKWEELINMHKDSNLRNVDELMNGTWHAWPETSMEEKGSWSYRNGLPKDISDNIANLNKWCNSGKEPKDISLNLFLIRFDSPPKYKRDKPLFFGFNGDTAKGAFIRFLGTFEGFPRDYYIKFN